MCQSNDCSGISVTILMLAYPYHDGHTGNIDGQEQQGSFSQLSNESSRSIAIAFTLAKWHDVSATRRADWALVSGRYRGHPFKRYAE